MAKKAKSNELISASRTNPKVDFYFNKAKEWKDEIAKLREIVLDCPVTEELKWGCPCYSFNGANIVLIHTFNKYCALLFMKGALLADPEGILIQQTKHVQAARQIRFTNLGEIQELEAAVKAYIYEAIEVEKAGLKVVLKKTEEFPMVEEFHDALNESRALKKAFYALTPGRQRGYLLYFAAPKQSKTRLSRIEKYTEHILDGKGLTDEYGR